MAVGLYSLSLSLLVTQELRCAFEGLFVARHFTSEERASANVSG